jgi:hypothetical protein
VRFARTFFCPCHKTYKLFHLAGPIWRVRFFLLPRLKRRCLCIYFGDGPVGAGYGKPTHLYLQTVLQEEIDLLFRRDRDQPQLALLMDQIVFHKKRV